MTASRLFAKDSGTESCYICGCPCGRNIATKDFIKQTFTNRDIVINPAGEYVCNGCVLSMREKFDLTLCDGEKRINQRVRLYSWVLTESTQTAASKAHLDFLLKSVIQPPDPPFAIILSDSGQKHLVFRGVVNYSREVYIVSLEDSHYEIRRSELTSILTVCKKIIAAVGKMARTKIDTPYGYKSIMAFYGVAEAEKILSEWDAIKYNPAINVIWWLAPNKEKCENEFRKIDAGDIPAKTGGDRIANQKISNERSLFD